MSTRRFFIPINLTNSSPSLNKPSEAACILAFIISSVTNAPSFTVRVRANFKAALVLRINSAAFSLLSTRKVLDFNTILGKPSRSRILACLINQPSLLSIVRILSLPVLQSFQEIVH